MAFSLVRWGLYVPPLSPLLPVIPFPPLFPNFSLRIINTFEKKRLQSGNTGQLVHFKTFNTKI